MRRGAAGRIRCSRLYDVLDDVIDIDIAIGETEYVGRGIAPRAFYAIDFGVLSTGETALVEMNDGFAVGAYSIDAANYTDTIAPRWVQLMSYKK